MAELQKCGVRNICRSTPGARIKTHSTVFVSIVLSKDSSLACVSNSTFRLSGSANHGRSDVLWWRSILTVAGAVVQEIDLEGCLLHTCRLNLLPLKIDWGIDSPTLKESCRSIQKSNFLKKNAVSLSASHPLKLQECQHESTQAQQQILRSQPRLLAAPPVLVLFGERRSWFLCNKGTNSLLHSQKKRGNGALSNSKCSHFILRLFGQRFLKTSKFPIQ